MLKTAEKIKEAEQALRIKDEALIREKKKEKVSVATTAARVEEMRAAIAIERAAEALNAAREAVNSSQRPSLNINGAPFDLTSAIDHAFVMKSASEVAIGKAFDANVLPVLASTQNENARQESLIAGKIGTQAEQNQAVNDAYEDALSSKGAVKAHSMYEAGLDFTKDKFPSGVTQSSLTSAGSTPTVLTNNDGLLPGAANLSPRQRIDTYLQIARTIPELQQGSFLENARRYADQQGLELDVPSPVLQR